MNKNDTLRNLLLAGAVFVLAMAVFPLIMPVPPPRPPLGVAEQSGGESKDTSVAEPARPSETSDVGLGQAKPNAVQASRFNVVEAPEEITFTLGTADALGQDSPFRSELVLSNIGASVLSASLTDHAEELRRSDRYQLLTGVEQDPALQHRSLAIEKVNIDDADVSLVDKKWHSSGVTEYQSNGEQGQAATFWIELEQEGQPVLKLARTLRLPRQDGKSGRHDLWSKLEIENLSSEPHRVVLTYRGGLGVRTANLRADDIVFDAGIRDSGGFVTGLRKPHGEVLSSRSVVLYDQASAGAGNQFTWAAVANTYFTCTVAPVVPGNMAQVTAIDLDGSAVSINDTTLRFVTRSETVPPGASLAYDADIYLGQKEADSFRKFETYASRNYYYQISQGYGSCTFNWLVELMVALLNGLYRVVRDYGVAIMILVLIVRALLHPITKKGQVDMVRMQHKMSELAPKIEEVKRKYANDKARMNQEMMKLNINPAGQMLTCLPMFLQMPIWVALWMSLSTNVLMRHEGFLFTWIRDLTVPDNLISFSSPVTVPLFGWQIFGFNLLPILVSGAMYFQMKTQPKPRPNPNQTKQQREQQETMQRMMPMMNVMMLLLFYNAPSGLNLYILSSTLIGTLEQFVIRKHIKEREEAGTLHKAAKTIDAGSPDQRRDGAPGFFERLSKMAVEAQKEKRTPKAKDRR